MNSKAQQIAQVLLERKAIRDSMDTWSRHCGYEPALHHRFLNLHLEKLARREFRKLMIFMPPGAAKSTYTSRLFPSWFLSQDAKQTILLCSHSKDLAQNFGRTSRNFIDASSSELGFSLAKDSQAADEWGTDKGGGFFCAGVGGRIAGRRADLALIDDPIGSVQDADSKDVRDTQWDWWKTDLKPRLKPNASLGIIQTRWHEDDLSGRILSQERDQWNVIRIPMEAEDNDPLGRKPGELLWPEWFTQEMADDAKKDSRTWNSLYQQNPTPESGNYFNVDGIREYSSYDSLPVNLRIYTGSDHALDLKEENDFTCMPSVGVDEYGNLWVLPVLYWDKCDTLQCVNEMFASAHRRAPLMWFCEAQHIEKAIGPFLFKRMSEEEFYFSIQQLSSIRDKRSKARPLQGRIGQGKVFFPSFAKWWPKAKHELAVFPSGAHDDFVDALANICRGLESMIKPNAVRTPKKVVSPLSVQWVKRQSIEQERQKVLAKLDY